MKLIFELSETGRRNSSQSPGGDVDISDIPELLLRANPPVLPEVSEMQAVRHFTRLSQRNFSIDTHFYPLGSCTMKYNPRACNSLSMLPEFLGRHPHGPETTGQGFLACMYELQEMLTTLTGMAATSLTPMAGAQGEFAGIAMIRAYHETNGDDARNEILVPDAAHGTNPATAVMCGYKVREIPTGDNGDMDLDALKAAVGSRTAGLMLTNPSTLGVFDRGIDQVQQVIHKAGGLLYYDGANLNAILGKVKPGDMGFDVMHINLHKTFSTPHGGGGPGAGPVAANETLAPFLPVPMVAEKKGSYFWATETTVPQTIGRLSANMGNASILLRAYVYARLLGKEGMSRVADYSVLNANYMMHRLKDAGFDLAFPGRRATHEFIITLKKLKEETGVLAMDVAKRLLDKGFHAPTTYFPLLVPECFLIEPTETEDKAILDEFVDALSGIIQEAYDQADKVTGAPYTTPVRRLDDVKAAREPDLAWKVRPE